MEICHDEHRKTVRSSLGLCSSFYDTNYLSQGDSRDISFIGRSVKRDAVLVHVETSDGLVGWGEAHHGRCPGAIARLVDTTLRELVTGMDPMDVCGVWARVYKMQIGSHGMGTAAALALSGLDLALWDLRCQVAGLPLYG